MLSLLPSQMALIELERVCIFCWVLLMSCGVRPRCVLGTEGMFEGTGLPQSPRDPLWLRAHTNECLSVVYIFLSHSVSLPLCLSDSLAHSLPLSHSSSYSLSHSLILSFSLILSVRLSFSISVFLTLSPSPPLSHSISYSHSLPYSCLVLSLSFSLSLSLHLIHFLNLESTGGFLQTLFFRTPFCNF